MAGESADTLNASRETFIEKNDVVNLMERVHPVIDELLKNKREIDGGTKVEFRARVNVPGTLQVYAGRDIPVRSTRQILKPGELPWRKLDYQIDIDGDVDYMNQGDPRIVDLADETYEAGMEDIAMQLASMFFNATGAGNTLHGLPAITAAAAYAGIDPAVDAAWAVNRHGTAAAPVAFTLNGIDELMNRSWARGARYTMASLSEVNYRVLQASNRAKTQTIFNLPEAADAGKLNLGQPERLLYNNCWFRLDSFVPDTEVYFHDFRRMHLYLPKGKNRSLTIGEWKFRSDHGRDEYIAQMLAVAQFVCRARHHQGVYHVV